MIISLFKITQRAENPHLECKALLSSCTKSVTLMTILWIRSTCSPASFPPTTVYLCHKFSFVGKLMSVLFPTPAAAHLEFSPSPRRICFSSFAYSEAFKWALLSIPLAESCSRCWSDVDHMQSLCMTVLTLHSVCLFSQGFPWRGKMGLATFFCQFKTPQWALAFRIALWTGLGDANQVWADLIREAD